MWDWSQTYIKYREEFNRRIRITNVYTVFHIRHFCIKMFNEWPGSIVGNCKNYLQLSYLVFCYELRDKCYYYDLKKRRNFGWRTSLRLVRVDCFFDSENAIYLCVEWCRFSLVYNEWIIDNYYWYNYFLIIIFYRQGTETVFFFIYECIYGHVKRDKGI